MLLLLLAVLAPSIQDTVTIRSTESAVWAPALPLKPTLRLGTLDGAPEYSFGSIQQLAATSSGAFVTYDGSDTQLRRYDPAGHFLGVIGRAGAGPGEYRSVEGLLFLGDSLLVVWDPSNSRVSVFATGGEFRRTIPVSSGVFGGQDPLQPSADGRFVVRVASPVPSRDDPFQTQFLELDANGTIWDTIPEPASTRDHAHFVLMTSDGPRWDFPVESTYARTPAGALVRGHTSELGFWVMPQVGPVRHVIRVARPLRLEGPERTQWEAWRALFAERGHQPARALPSTKPLSRNLRADPGNRVWIEVYAEATQRPPKSRPPGDKRPQFTLRDASTYEVFTITGRYLGRVGLEPESTILAITATHLFVLTHGPEGEEQIAVHRLPPSS